MKIFLQNLQYQNFTKKVSPPPLKLLGYNLFKQIKFKKIIYKNILAFSLIELSVVLIIIGLLVAGISGGASLIESAKKRAFLNEINSYKQAFLAFYAKNRRYPGDINNIGFTGLGSGQTYNANSFPFPYDGTDTANNHYIPDNVYGPFVDMYLDKTLDFEPKGQANSTNPAFYTTNIQTVPFSKTFTNMFIYYEKCHDDNIKNEKYSKYDFNDIQTVVIRYPNIATLDKNKRIPHFMKDIDIKTDDGKYNAGSIRSSCGGKNPFAYNSYDEAIERNATCDVNFFKIL